MRVTEKGQVTIPKQLRDELGIDAGTEVEFERRDDTIVVARHTLLALGTLLTLQPRSTLRTIDPR